MFPSFDLEAPFRTAEVGGESGFAAAAWDLRCRTEREAGDSAGAKRKNKRPRMSTAPRASVMGLVRRRERATAMAAEGEGRLASTIVPDALAAEHLQC